MKKWIIYEIPGHKVGLCEERNYPERPRDQMWDIFGLHPRESVEGTHYRKVGTAVGTKPEAMAVEWEWQARLGYPLDGTKGTLARKRIGAATAKRTESHRKQSETLKETYRTDPALRAAVRKPRRHKCCLYQGRPYASIHSAERINGLPKGTLYRMVRKGLPGAPTLISREEYDSLVAGEGFEPSTPWL